MEWWNDYGARYGTIVQMLYVLLLGLAFFGIYGIWWDDYDYTATILILLMHPYVELLYIAYEIVMI